MIHNQQILMNDTQLTEENKLNVKNNENNQSQTSLKETKETMAYTNQETKSINPETPLETIKTTQRTTNKQEESKESILSADQLIGINKESNKRFQVVKNQQLSYLAGQNVVLMNQNTKEQLSWRQNGTSQPTCQCCMKSGNCFVVAQQNSKPFNMPKIIYWQISARTKKFLYMTNPLRFDFNEIEKIIDLIFDSGDNYLLVFAKQVPSSSRACGYRLVVQKYSNSEFILEHSMELMISLDRSQPKFQINPYSKQLQFFASYSDVFQAWKQEQGSKKPTFDIISKIQQARSISSVCQFKIESQVFIVVTSEPNFLLIQTDSFKLLKIEKIDKTYRKMFQFDNFLVGFMDDSIRVNDFIKRDKTFVTQTHFDMQTPGEVGTSGRIKCLDLVMTVQDEENPAYDIAILLDSGHFFKFSASNLYRTKSGSVSLDLISHKVVEEDIISISVCRRKNIYLTVSGKNDLCLYNEDKTYNQLKLNSSPQDAIIHVWGYQMFLIYYKHVEIYSLLDKEFLLTSKFQVKQAISNMKISENGSLIAISSMDTIMVQDAFNLKRIDRYQAKLENGHSINCLVFVQNDNYLVFTDIRKAIYIMDLSLGANNSTHTLHHYFSKHLNPNFVTNSTIWAISSPEVDSVTALSQVKAGEFLIAILQNGNYHKIDLLYENHPSQSFLPDLTSYPLIKFPQKPNLILSFNLLQCKSSFIVTNTQLDDQLGYIYICKQFNPDDPQFNLWESFPAHSSRVVDISFSHCNNSLWTLGSDGIVIRWTIPQESCSENEMTKVNEQLLSQKNLKEMEEQNELLLAKQKFTREDERRKFNENMKILQDEIDQLKKEKDEELNELQKKQNEIVLSSQKESEIIKETTTKENEKLKHDKEELTNDLEKIIEKYKKQKSSLEKDQHEIMISKKKKNKDLSNQQIELIKKIVNEQHLKLQEKDSQIKNLDAELQELTKEQEDCQGDINSRIFTARRRGINDSINQIKFLQSEVLSCKNLLAERLKESQEHNSVIKQLAQETENAKAKTQDIHEDLLKSKNYNEFLKQEIKSKQIDMDKYERKLTSKSNEQEQVDSQILAQRTRWHQLDSEYHDLKVHYEKLEQVKVEHEKTIRKLKTQESKLLATQDKLKQDNEQNEKENTHLCTSKQNLTAQIARMKDKIDEALTSRSHEAMYQVILNMCLLYLWNDPEQIQEEDINVKGKIGGYASLQNTNRYKLENEVLALKTQLKRVYEEQSNANVKAFIQKGKQEEEYRRKKALKKRDHQIKTQVIKKIFSSNIADQLKAQMGATHRSDQTSSITQRLKDLSARKKQDTESDDNSAIEKPTLPKPTEKPNLLEKKMTMKMLRTQTSFKIEEKKDNMNHEMLRPPNLAKLNLRGNSMKNEYQQKINQRKELREKVRVQSRGVERPTSKAGSTNNRSYNDDEMQVID